MTKRGWWLVVLNFLDSRIRAGARRQPQARPLRAGRHPAALDSSSVLGIVLYFAGARSAVLGRDQLPCATARGAGRCSSAYAVLWLVLTVDTLRLVRLVRASPTRPDWLVAGLAVVTLVATAGPATYGAYIVGVQRGFVSTLFGTGRPADPVDGNYNILLLGGDAGPDRDGLRPDSITVVSIDAETGRATMIGLPRDLAACAVLRRVAHASQLPRRLRRLRRRRVPAQLDLHRGELYSPELYPERRRLRQRAGYRGDAGGGRGRSPASTHPVLRAHRHAGLRRSDRRARRRDDRREERVPMGGRSTTSTTTGASTTGSSRASSTSTATRRSGTPAPGTRRRDYDRMARQRELQDGDASSSSTRRMCSTKLPGHRAMPARRS